MRKRITQNTYAMSKHPIVILEVSTRIARLFAYEKVVSRDAAFQITP